MFDQHPLWLDALEQLLSQDKIEVVGKSTDPEEAAELVEELKPDVFISELSSGEEMDAELESVRRARAAHPDVRTVVLTPSDDRDQIDAAFDAGAGVVCVKTAAPDDLLTAIRQSFCHSIYVADLNARRSAHVAERRRTEVPELTKRELEILRLVAEGSSNSQLARMLWVTEQTVKFHLSNIYRKLGVANRTEASRWAQLNGLLGPAPAAEAAVA
ncbi:MAG TPA: response regulator transcription factor [Gaiellaceae bacterium]|nr:response regulator transcription factor [Gaiellaceae bacterium]